MDIQKYNKATEILKNIEHINKVIEFIRSIKNSGTTIRMEESGFVSHPESVMLEKWEFDDLIETYEAIKYRLERELAEL